MMRVGTDESRANDQAQQHRGDWQSERLPAESLRDERTEESDKQPRNEEGLEHGAIGIGDNAFATRKEERQTGEGQEQQHDAVRCAFEKPVWQGPPPEKEATAQFRKREKKQATDCGDDQESANML